MYQIKVSNKKFKKIKDKEISIFLIDPDDYAYANIHVAHKFEIINEKDEVLTASVFKECYFDLQSILAGYFDVNKTGYTEDNIYDSFIEEHRVDDPNINCKAIEFRLI